MFSTSFIFETFPSTYHDQLHQLSTNCQHCEACECDWNQCNKQPKQITTIAFCWETTNWYLVLEYTNPINWSNTLLFYPKSNHYEFKLIRYPFKLIQYPLEDPTRSVFYPKFNQQWISFSIDPISFKWPTRSVFIRSPTAI